MWTGGALEIPPRPAGWKHWPTSSSLVTRAVFETDPAGMSSQYRRLWLLLYVVLPLLLKWTPCRFLYNFLLTSVYNYTFTGSSITTSVANRLSIWQHSKYGPALISNVASRPICISFFPCSVGRCCCQTWNWRCKRKTCCWYKTEWLPYLHFILDHTIVFGIYRRS